MKGRLSLSFFFTMLVITLVIEGFTNPVFATNYPQLLQNTEELAYQGEAINSESMGLGNTKYQVLRKWGKPEKQSENTLQYEKRRVNFWLDDNGVVVNVVTRDKALLQVTPNQVEEVLGIPDEKEGAAGSIYWTYRTGTNDLIFRWNNLMSKKELSSVNIQ